MVKKGYPPENSLVQGLKMKEKKQRNSETLLTKITIKFDSLEAKTQRNEGWLKTFAPHRLVLINIFYALIYSADYTVVSVLYIHWFMHLIIVHSCVKGQRRTDLTEISGSCQRKQLTCEEQLHTNTDGSLLALKKICDCSRRFQLLNLSESPELSPNENIWCITKPIIQMTQNRASK